MSSRAAAGPPPMAAEPEAIRPADVAAAPAARADVSSGNGELTAQRDAPVGGQAVLEGVMMRGVSNWAVAVRKPAARRSDAIEGSPERAGPEGAPDGDAAGGAGDGDAAGGVPDGEAAGEIEVSSFPLTSALKRHRALRLPIIRGVVALGESLRVGLRAPVVSADAP